MGTRQGSREDGLNMRTLIILGNTREKSNTKALAAVFADVISAKGAEVRQIPLMEKNVQTCVGCDACHSICDSFGCAISDDMHEIADEILASDLVVLASPIYIWMPTPPLKAVMDRLYAFTKYPKFPSFDGAFNLGKKQKYAMLATCGDDPKTNCDLFDESVRRMAKFANLPYIGYLAARDNSGGNIITENVIADVHAFVEKCF